jgi:hypothetical protein
MVPQSGFAVGVRLDPRRHRVSGSGIAVVLTAVASTPNPYAAWGRLLPELSIAASPEENVARAGSVFLRAPRRRPPRVATEAKGRRDDAHRSGPLGGRRPARRLAGDASRGLQPSRRSSRPSFRLARRAPPDPGLLGVRRPGGRALALAAPAGQWREHPIVQSPGGDVVTLPAASATCRRLKNCQAVSTAVRHVSIAAARSVRCVWAEVRWRWTLKVL